MTDITANATVYPSANDVAETEDDGRFATEIRHTDYARLWVKNFVVSGFVLPASDPDLTITIPLGEAVIDGRRVEISATTDLLLVASQTNHIFLQLSFDGSGEADGVDMVTNTTGIPPASSVKIGRAITDGSSVTSTKDERPSSPYLNRSVGPGELTGFFGNGSDAFEIVSSTSFVDLTGMSVSILQAEVGFRPDGITAVRTFIMYQAEIESQAIASDFEIQIQSVGDDVGLVVQKTATITAPATGTKHSLTVMTVALLDILDGFTIKVQAKRVGAANITLREGRFFVQGVD